MSQFLFILAGSLPALLRSRADLVIENIALRQQVAVIKGSSPGHACRRLTGSSGCWSTGAGPAGRTRSISSSLQPLCDGTGQVFGPSGAAPALAIAAWTTGPPSGGQGDPRPDPAPGPREPDMGRAACAFRAAEARIRGLGFDRDSTLSQAVIGVIRSFGIIPSPTAYRSPWQNPVSERWIGSVRREM